VVGCTRGRWFTGRLWMARRGARGCTRTERRGGGAGTRGGTGTDRSGGARGGSRGTRGRGGPEGVAGGGGGLKFNRFGVAARRAARNSRRVGDTVSSRTEMVSKRSLTQYVRRQG